MTDSIRKQWRRKLPEHLQAMPPAAQKIYGDIWKRHLDDLNWFMTAIGKVGSGKSTSLLKFLYECSTDPFTGERTFDVERDVVFTVKEYLNLVEKIKPDYDAGRSILFDEIELEANSKGWDYLTKLFVHTCSTMRYKLNIVGATLPIEKQLAFQGRQLRDANLHCKFINRRFGYMGGRYHLMDYKLTADTDKTALTIPAKRLAVKRIDDLGDDYYAVNKISKVRVYNVPRKIDKVYKKKKFEYLDEYYRKWKKDLEDMDSSKTKINPEKVFEYIDANKDLVCDEKGIPNPTLLEMKIENLGISQSRDICRAYKVLNAKKI